MPVDLYYLRIWLYGIPPMQFRENLRFRGHRSLVFLSTEILPSPNLNNSHLVPLLLI